MIFFTRWILTFGIAIAASTTAAHGAVVSSHFISRDTASPVMLDALNHREWLGWDTTQGLTYTDMVAAIAANGPFAGFHIAHISDAERFTMAIFGTSDPLPDAAFAVVPSAVIAVVGNNLEVLDTITAADGSDITLDAALYLNGSANTTYGGLIIQSSAGQSEFDRSDEAIETGDIAATAELGVGWLAYRDVAATEIPEPGSLALIALGLAGLAMRRRRTSA